VSRYLLDTNICIHWSKDEFSLRQKVQQIGVENCFISELTLAELIYGIAKSAPPQHHASEALYNCSIPVAA
jgi:tRNA(fMet)-specific endonuclease VapC